MDEEREEWRRKYSSNLGARELLRLLGVFLVWMILGGSFSIVFDSPIILVSFLIVAFAFSFFSNRWKPAYSILRKALGNNNLPTEPMPLSHTKFFRKVPWWFYVSAAWRWLIGLILLYFVINYFTK